MLRYIKRWHFDAQWFPGSYESLCSDGGEHSRLPTPAQLKSDGTSAPGNFGFPTVVRTREEIAAEDSYRGSDHDILSMVLSGFDPAVGYPRGGGVGWNPPLPAVPRAQKFGGTERNGSVA